MSESAEVLDDLSQIRTQMQRLRVPLFGEDDAWRLGCSLRDRAAGSGASVTVEIRVAGATVFLCAMPGTSPANADWARRKRNVVELLGEPSYAVGLQGGVLEAMALDPRDHADHGGAVPIRLIDGAMVGVVTVSGLPQRDDHELVVAELARMVGIDPALVALEPRLSTSQASG
jgi:uncharacterized protein (UPF0303 family)